MRLLTSLLAIATLAGVGLASAQPPAGPSTPEAIVYALLSRDPVTRKAAEAAAVQTGAPMVGPLCDLMAEGSTKSVTVAEKTLFAIAAAASAPGADAMREAVGKAISAQVQSGRPARVRCYLAGLTPTVGGVDACMAAVWCTLNADTFEAGRAALRRMTGGDTWSYYLVKPDEKPLPKAIPGHDGPQDTVVLLLRAAGERRDATAVPLLPAFVGSGPVERRAAALDALGAIGDTRAAVALAEAAAEPDEAVRSAAVGALIALADAEQQRGGSFARRCYRKAYDYAVTPAQKTAALMGLADTDPSMRVQWLLRGMAEAHTRPVASAELLKFDPAQLAGPLRRRLPEAQGEELEALRSLAAAKEITVGP